MNYRAAPTRRSRSCTPQTHHSGMSPLGWHRPMRSSSCGLWSICSRILHSKSMRARQRLARSSVIGSMYGPDGLWTENISATLNKWVLNVCMWFNKFNYWRVYYYTATQYSMSIKPTDISKAKIKFFSDQSKASVSILMFKFVQIV